jgi:hypothetical protein
MTKFFIKYVPPRRGLTAVEYLEDYLSSINSSVMFSPSFYDQMSTFGVLEGSGDDLSKVLRTIENRSGAVRYNEIEFAGASVHSAPPQYFGPIEWEPEKAYLLNQFIVIDGSETNTFKCLLPGISGLEPPIWPTEIAQEITDGTITWVKEDTLIQYIPKDNRFDWPAWLYSMGITVQEGDQLNCAKEYKSNLLKEIAKKKFYDDNDSIADLSKAVMAISVHYNDFTLEEKGLVDTQIAILKQIYTKEVAINGLTELTNHLSSILVAYYTAKMTVTAATTIEEVGAVIYE